MHRTDGDSNVANLFDEGDPGVPRAPTQVDADWLNAVQEELCNAIENAGITLVKGTNTQLRTAMVNTLTAQTIAGVKSFTSSISVTTVGTTAIHGISSHPFNAASYGVVAEGATGDITFPTSKAAFRIVPQYNDPSTPLMGDLYVNAADGKLRIYDGSNWVVVGTQT